MQPTIFRASCVSLLLLVGGVVAQDAAQAPDKKLAEIDAQIKTTADDPLLHYQRAQLLARLTKYDEAYAAAQQAMALFVKTKTELAWLQLDAFEAGGRQVTVHFNMGPDERRSPETGIVRPLSFRIWSADRKAIDEIIDFEIGYLDGKPLTAAFGQTTETVHANFGPAKPDLPYSKIRTAAIELIGKRVSSR